MLFWLSRSIQISACTMPLTLVVLAEMLDLDREAVRHLLVHERHELLADHLGDAEREIAVGDHVLREQQRPHRQTREDLVDGRGCRGSSPVCAEIGIMAGERAIGEALQRRQQLRLARQRVDLVEHEERAVELVAENLDQRAVVLADALRLDDEQRDIAVLDRLMDLSAMSLCSARFVRRAWPGVSMNTA